MQIISIILMGVLVCTLGTRLVLNPNGSLFFVYKTYPNKIFLRLPITKPGEVRYIEQLEKNQFRLNVRSKQIEIGLHNGDKKIEWMPVSSVKMGYKAEGQIDLMPGLPEGLYINDYYSSGNID